MQKQYVQKVSGFDQKSKSLEPRIGNSHYVVNNSLHCCLQPKRTSFDVKLYMQLHRKLLRKAIIQQKFQQSLYHLSNQINYARKGFKGKAIPQNIILRSVSFRQKRAYTQASTPQHASNAMNNSQGLLSQQSDMDQPRKYTAAQQSHQKPNMMYNLSLYRKSYRRNELKQDKISMNVLQSISKTKETASMNSTLRRSKKMLTIS